MTASQDFTFAGEPEFSTKNRRNGNRDLTLILNYRDTAYRYKENRSL